MQVGQTFFAAPWLRQYRLLTLFLMVLAGQSACSIAPQMASTAAQATDLTGMWVLDRHESDDVRARLKPLIEKKEHRWRSLEKRMMDESFASPHDDEAPQPGGLPGSGPAGGPGSTDGSTMQWMRQQRLREAEALIAFIAPAMQLDIRMSTREGHPEVTVKSDKGEGTRVLVPGQASALFVGLGGFKMNSGWHGGAFIVDLQGTGDNSVQVVQYYTLADAGNRMDVRMEGRFPELGKQAFRFVYKRDRSQ